jgi:hypothetical protein
MNFITHREAVSLFPRATIIDRTFYVSSKLPLEKNWNPVWAQKYRKRGYNIDVSSVVLNLPVGFRRVNDKYSWTIRFEKDTGMFRFSRRPLLMSLTDVVSSVM